MKVLCLLKFEKKFEEFKSLAQDNACTPIHGSITFFETFCNCYHQANFYNFISNKAKTEVRVLVD